MNAGLLVAGYLVGIVGSCLYARLVADYAGDRAIGYFGSRPWLPRGRRSGWAVAELGSLVLIMAGTSDGSWWIAGLALWRLCVDGPEEVGRRMHNSHLVARVKRDG